VYTVRAESSNNLMMRSHQLGLGIISSHAEYKQYTVTERKDIFAT
jgi:hypothetical protein